MKVMKHGVEVGDLVRFPTGYGNETLVGIYLGCHDNPADVAALDVITPGTPAHLPKQPRQVADLWANGEKHTSWLHHVKLVTQ
tara:strand:- start:1414 stop:1662 length:249 start_codon:yes stop_codon:yes gene_type:complete